jgi:acyl-CoA synthetase (AMP-forming)/AMP-acid ligase II
MPDRGARPVWSGDGGRDRERKAGSIGTPVEGVEIKLVDGDGNDAKAGEVGEIGILDAAGRDPRGN